MRPLNEYSTTLQKHRQTHQVLKKSCNSFETGKRDGRSVGDQLFVLNININLGWKKIAREDYQVQLVLLEEENVQKTFQRCQMFPKDVEQLVSFHFLSKKLT